MRAPRKTAVYIPPNGFVGQANQSQANQYVGVRTRKAPTRKRRKAKKAAAPRKARRTRRSTKRPARLVKGSAAAKRYMASIRRKRRRK